MTPIIKRENMTAIARIKANCVMKTSELDVYDDEFHTDFTGTLTTGIYYINSNDSSPQHHNNDPITLLLLVHHK